MDDSSHCFGNEFLIAIKTKVTRGELTYADVIRRLNLAIDLELNKPADEIDMPLVRAMQDFLYQIHTGEKYVSNMEARKEEMKRRFAHTQRAMIQKKRMIAAVSFVVGISIMLFIADGLLHRKWLKGRTTKDEQQYVIEGQVIDPGFVDRGNADSGVGSVNFITSDYAEATNFLGFSFPQPTPLPDGWSLRDFRCIALPGVRWVSCSYVSNEHENDIVLDIKIYDDPVLASDEVEQNAHGDFLDLRGQKTYVSTNLDMTTAVWLEGSVSYTLYTPFTEEELVLLISSLQ